MKNTDKLEEEEEETVSVEFVRSREADMKSGRVPQCLYWTCEQVGEFFSKRLNLPEYRVSPHTGILII